MALTLFPTYGGPGIATAEITAGWVNAALLFGMLLWRGHWKIDLPLLTRIPRLLIAAGLMALAIHYALTYFAFELSSAASIAVRAGTLLGLVFAAAVLYFGLAFLSGGASLRMVKRGLKRKPKTVVEDKET
jgi:putative peptidoglycan lipid II flippase